MKTKSILICLLFAIAANSFTAAKAQAVDVNDSLALVDLYNSTDGPNWYNHINWLTTKPLSTWSGITVTNGRVMYIFLFSNNLKGTLPASIGNLTALLDLDLVDNQLSGTIPAEIGNLTNLFDLGLFTNQLTGSLPATLGNLKNLYYLELEVNQLNGDIAAEVGSLPNIPYINLADNQLTGTIPATIGNLGNLSYLYINNNGLTGAIPPEIGNLTNLHNLDLHSNQLNGTIPAEIGNLKNLNYLYLNNNQLSGTIPAEIGSLKHLDGLSLSYNQLRGTVPASLKKLTSLRYVDISNNQLSAFGYAGSFINPHHKLVGSVENNLFTFDGLQVIAKNFHGIVYAPQDTILPIHQSGNVLSLSAGGMLSNNKYKWYKAGSADSTIIKGDSAFTPLASGKYYAKVTNAIATQLTLYSDTISYTMPLMAQTQNSVANVAAVKIVNSHFSIYPNPAKDIIHVQVAGNAMITITNSAGKVLLTKTINNSDAINVSGYANGIYYIQNKTTRETQKIVVVH